MGFRKSGQCGALKTLGRTEPAQRERSLKTRGRKEPDLFGACILYPGRSLRPHGPPTAKNHRLAVSGPQAAERSSRTPSRTRLTSAVGATHIVL
jgi:hypothetical protein